MTKLAAEVAAASREESEGVGHLNEAVARMDVITQKNASGAEETAAAAEELNAQAHTLRSSVESLQGLVGGAGSSGYEGASAKQGRASEPRAETPSSGSKGRSPGPAIRPVLARNGSHPKGNEISSAVRDDFFTDAN